MELGHSNAGTDRACEFCVDAGMAFDWCRVCGRGLPAPPPEPPPSRPFFDGSGCGHPPDPIAVNLPNGYYGCHCGRMLDPEDGHKVEEAPGPVVHCEKCGCHVALIGAEAQR